MAIGAGLGGVVLGATGIYLATPRNGEIDVGEPTGVVADPVVSDPFADGERSSDAMEFAAIDGAENLFWEPAGGGVERLGGAYGEREGATVEDYLLARDFWMSDWYLAMGGVLGVLERHTGHRFEKQAGKRYATPVEILEEQLAFMRAFQEETLRMAREVEGER